MFKSKQKNQYGTFIIEKSGNKKTVRILFTAVMAVIFILGTGVILFNNSKKPKRQAIAETAASSDSIPGWWYQQYFSSSVCDKDSCQLKADPDKDGLTNAQEFYYHTDPLKAFTVKDKLSDGQLVAAGFDPSRAGHMTFDQVTSEDNLLGESLVFNQDIKKLINESVDISKVALPVVSDAEIKMTHNNSKESIQAYLDGTKKIYSQYFPNDFSSYISNAMGLKDETQISNTKSRMIKAYADLTKVPVPDDFIQIQKFSLAFLKVLPDILDVPNQDVLLDEYNQAGNSWYEKTQAAFSLYQKITLETKRLQDKYKNAQ